MSKPGKHSRGFIPMSSEGPQFFDIPSVFEVYQQHRQRPENPNDSMEKPVVMDLIGDFIDCDVLDLGCGDASIGVELLERGARSYVGVEASQNMLAIARENTKDTTALLIDADIRSWSSPAGAFDLILSRLVLQYVDDINDLFENVRQSLRPGGLLVFSVEHPVITSCDKAWQGVGLRQDWLVDNYFNSGKRDTHWLGELVTKYHRTIEDYFVALQDAGFTIERLHEGRPHPDFFQDRDTFERRKRIPLFLIMSARKPGTANTAR